MERRQMRQIVFAGLGLLAVSAPAFAQEAAPASFNWYEMISHMSAAGIAVPGGPGQFHKNDQRWPVHSSAGL